MKNNRHSLTELHRFDGILRKIMPYVVGMMFLLIASISYADTQTSKVYLARANQLIESSLVMVEKARKADCRNDSDTSFNYRALEADLSDIREGVKAYINDRVMLPESIHRLNKHYQFQGVSHVTTR